MREAAIGALRAIGAPSVEALGACLRESDLAVQESASAILTTVADRRVLLPLIEALASGDWIVRMHAAKALGRIGAVEAVAPLVPPPVRLAVSGHGPSAASLKVAVTFWTLFIVTTHVAPVPEHGPPQPANVLPAPWANISRRRRRDTSSATTPSPISMSSPTRSMRPRKR